MWYLDHVGQPSNTNDKGMDMPTQTQRHIQNKPSIGHTLAAKNNPDSITILVLPY